MNLVVVGTGYVGLTSALGYVQLGHRVACVDMNAEKISALDLGQVPFFEEGLTQALRAAQEVGAIIFTTDLKAVLPEADMVLLCVGTPATSTGEANLSYLFSAAREVGEHLDHEAVIIVKSTVPVGTNRRVLDEVRSSMILHGRTDLAPLIRVVSVPEFLREGSAFTDFLAPERVVIGTDDDVTFRLVEEMHRGIQTTIVKTSIETAELIKYAANAMLATKISFINEIANMAERTGADVEEVARGIGLDSRIGPHFLRAGIGYGGSCFPKDVSALHHVAKMNGYEFKLLSAVIEVNNRQREFFLKKILETLIDVKGRRIAVWGLTFKANTDDIRESASIEVVRRLVGLGADVMVYDPKGMENAKRVLPESVLYAQTAIDAADGAEALVVLTEWPEFLDVSFSTLKERMIDPVIFDGRNILRKLHLEKFGFRYVGVGFTHHS